MLMSKAAARHEAKNFPLGGFFKIAAGGEGLNRGVLLKALDMLNTKLAAAKAKICLWMIGGGAMMLHLDSRDSSGDLDVVPWKGDFPAMMRFAEEVAKEMRAGGTPIPEDWINGDFSDQLRTLRVTPADFVVDPRYHWSNMEIRFARPELMLALKAFSMRPEGHDRQDLRVLMDKIPVRDLDHFYDILEHYGDIEMLAEGDDVFLESLFKNVRSLRKPV